MSSIHRRVACWLTHDPEDERALTPTVLGLHFTTARPHEVRLRLPMAQVYPDYDGPGTYAAWPWDRTMLKASIAIAGAKFGIGDVRAGMGPHSWLCELRRAPFRVVVGAHPLWLYRFVLSIDALCPPESAAVDVDACIADLLRSAS